MGLVGDFSENDLFIYFRWLIRDFSRAASLYLLPRILPDSLPHGKSDGESLSSVASLQLENLRTKARNMQATFGQMPKVMIFMVSDILRPDLSRIFR